MKIKPRVYSIIILICVMLLYLILGTSQNAYAKIKKIRTVHGEGLGFYISHKGHFLTHYDNTKNLVAGEIIHSSHVRDKARVLMDSKLEGYSLLKVDKTIKESLYPLGDSDTVDVGDTIYLPGIGKVGKILLKVNNFNTYGYPCFIARLPKTRAKLHIGKPVLDSNKKVIGMYVSYLQEHYVIIPINRIKLLIKQSYRSKNTMPKPGLEKEKKSASPSNKINATPFILDLKPIKQFGGNPDYHFGSIKDMAFDQDNNLYIIDDKYNEIKKISFSGLTKEFSPFKEVFPAKEELTKESEKDKKSEAKKKKESAEKSADKEKKAEKKEKEPDLEVKEEAKPVKPIFTINTIKYKLKKPVSLTVTAAGLIYVLDQEARKIVIFNKDLQLVDDSLSYHNKNNIRKNFIPVKIRAKGNKVFLLSGLNRLYQLVADKKAGITRPYKITIKGYGEIFPLLDMAYDTKQFYWLNKKDRYIQAINNRWRLTNKFKIRGDFPTSFSILGNRIYAFDQETNRIGVYSANYGFIRYWSGDITTKEGNPRIMRVSPTGIMAIAYQDQSHIRLFHLNGQLLKILSPFSNKSKEMESPLSLALDRLGRLLVITGNSDIHLINTLNDSYQNRQVKYPSRRNLNLALRGISIGATNKVFVSDTKNDRVIALPNPFSGRSFSGKELGELNQPVQLTSAKGKVYILDKENNRVVILNEQGVLQKAFKIQDKNKRVMYPQDIAITVQEDFTFDKKTEAKEDSKKDSKKAEKKLPGPLKEIVLSGKRESKKVNPKDIEGKTGEAAAAIPEINDIYIYVLAENKVLKYDSTGKFITEFAIKSGEQSYLGYAKGITYDSGTVFVADTYHHRILAYNEKGDFMREFGQLGGELGDFCYPWDLIAHHNNLYIIDKGNHRVVHYGYPIKKKEAKEIDEKKDNKKNKK